MTFIEGVKKNRPFCHRENGMNIDEIFAEIDRLYTANQGEKVEEYILEKIGEAAKAGNESIMIQLLNELIGH